MLSSGPNQPAQTQQQQQQQQQQQLFASLGGHDSQLLQFNLHSNSGSGSSTAAHAMSSSAGNTFSARLANTNQQSLLQQQQHRSSCSLYGSSSFAQGHPDFALAPRSNMPDTDASIMGSLSMPRVLSGGLEQWQQQSPHQLFVQQQQQQQRDSDSTPLPPTLDADLLQLQQQQQQQQQLLLQQRDSFSCALPPTLDADLLHLQRQLAGTSLTADSMYMPGAGTHTFGNSSSSSASRLAMAAAMPGGLYSNSEPLPAVPEASPAGSPLCSALDDQIVRLVKLRQRLAAASNAAPTGPQHATAAAAPAAGTIHNHTRHPAAAQTTQCVGSGFTPVPLVVPDDQLVGIQLPCTNLVVSQSCV